MQPNLAELPVHLIPQHFLSHQLGSVEFVGDFVVLGVLDGSDVEVGGFEPGQGHRHVRDGPQDDLGVEMFRKIL